MDSVRWKLASNSDGRRHGSLDYTIVLPGVAVSIQDQFARITVVVVSQLLRYMPRI